MIHPLLPHTFTILIKRRLRIQTKNKGSIFRTIQRVLLIRQLSFTASSKRHKIHSLNRKRRHSAPTVTFKTVSSTGEITQTKIRSCHVRTSGDIVVYVHGNFSIAGVSVPMTITRYTTNMFDTLPYSGTVRTIHSNGQQIGRCLTNIVNIHSCVIFRHYTKRSFHRFLVGQLFLPHNVTISIEHRLRIQTKNNEGTKASTTFQSFRFRHLKAIVKHVSDPHGVRFREVQHLSQDISASFCHAIHLCLNAVLPGTPRTVQRA